MTYQGQGLTILEHATVVELKRWLECRNLKKTGAKSELVQQGKDAMTLGTPIDVKIDAARGQTRGMIFACFRGGGKSLLVGGFLFIVSF